MACALNFAELLRALGDHPVVARSTLHNKPTAFCGVSTDTRAELSGKVFFALKGPNFDGHDFLDTAVQKGAHYLVVEKTPRVAIAAAKLAGAAVIKVPSTLRALQNLASFWRERLTRTTVVGITGTNGKTSTKCLAHSICAPFLKSYKSRASFNNHIGVPLALLDTPLETQVAFLELGISAPNEMPALCRIASPHIVCVTNVGQGHLENFKSIDALAEAKAQIYTHSPLARVRIFNLDNSFTQTMYQQYQPLGSSVLYSAHKPEADVCFKGTAHGLGSMQITGRVQNALSQSRVPFSGEHNVQNLMAASSIALALNLKPQQIWQALSGAKLPLQRGQIMPGGAGFDVFFDAYNANPSSMQAFLHQLAYTPQLGLILGEMLELGPGLSAKAHFELGVAVAKLKPVAVVFVGASCESFLKGLGDSTTHYVAPNVTEDFLRTSTTALRGLGLKTLALKASRGMQLERFLRHL